MTEPARRVAEAAGLLAAKEALQSRMARLQLALEVDDAAAAGGGGGGGDGERNCGQEGGGGGGQGGSSSRAELEEQIAALELRLHITDDELEQRRASLSQSPFFVRAGAGAEPYEEFGARDAPAGV